MPYKNGVWGEVTNEDRADWGSNISRCSPDWGKNDLETDFSDALADVIHYMYRCGVDPDAVWEHAVRSAEGDLEDGPEAALDPAIAASHLS